jgi:hypothetical protein
MPIAIDWMKLHTPRMNSQPRTGCLSFGNGAGSSLTIKPSFVRTTAAYLAGPRIITPSSNACPPMLVRNPFFKAPSPFVE